MPRRRQAPAGPRRSAVPCRPIRCASHPLGSRRPLSPLAGALASPRPVIPPSPVPGMPGDGCPSCQRRRRWLPAVTIAPQLFSTLRGMKATIEVTGLRKRFGRTVALDGLSFTVTPGDVTGFVGPNGAGKSTTMRVILGLDAADEGSALIGGQPARSLRHPLNHVGALLDAAALQPSRTAPNHLMSELQDTASHLVVIGRGQLVADTSVADLIAAASSGRVTLRTAARSEAMTVLAHAGATVAATDRDTLTVSGLGAERVVALLGESAVPFSEVSAHHATLEEAYMELTRETVEFRAAAGEAAR